MDEESSLWWTLSSRRWTIKSCELNLTKTEVWYFCFHFDFYQLCRVFCGEPGWHLSMNFVGFRYPGDPVVTSPNISVENENQKHPFLGRLTRFRKRLTNICKKWKYMLYFWKCIGTRISKTIFPCKSPFNKDWKTPVFSLLTFDKFRKRKREKIWEGNVAVWSKVL